MSCAVETAKGWAIGMISAAVAIGMLALAIGGAIRVTYHKPGPLTRVCAIGHDAYNSAYQDTTFVCDKWVPLAQPSPEATP